MQLRNGGAKGRLERGLGEKLFLFGSKELSGKSPFDRRAYAPGQHGQSKKKPTQYGRQLREKQKVRCIYGIRTERQFRNYFKKAEKLQGEKGVNLLQLLELRLDAIVYSLGFATTMAEARQLVSHRSVNVNDQRVDIPSYQVKVGDVVSIAEKAQQQVRIKDAIELSKSRKDKSWINVNGFKGTVLALPNKDEMVHQGINEALIVELYSK